MSNPIVSNVCVSMYGRKNEEFFHTQVLGLVIAVFIAVVFPRELFTV